MTTSNRVTDARNKRIEDLPVERERVEPLKRLLTGIEFLQYILRERANDSPQADEIIRRRDLL